MTQMSSLGGWSVGSRTNLEELHGAAPGKPGLEQELALALFLKTEKSVSVLANDQALLEAEPHKTKMEVVNVSGWCRQT